MSSTLTPLSPDSAALQHPAAYAAVLDQLSHTVHQLLLDALARARELPVGAAPARLAPPVPAQLSSRECEVLQRIAAGDSNKMIARALDLSPHTVKRHVANILDKLGLRTRVQAAAWWMKQLPGVRDH